jgi:hypothetical protein
VKRRREEGLIRRKEEKNKRGIKRGEGRMRGEGPQGTIRKLWAGKNSSEV